MSDSAGNAANASSNPSASQLNVRDQAPLRQYVTKVDKVGTGGGNIFHQVYRGSYSRVKCHLLKTKGDKFIYPLLILWHLDPQVRLVLPVPITIMDCKCKLPNVEREPKKRKEMEEPLEKAFNNNAREELDSEIARMFYTGGLSFHFARNPHYVQAFTKAYTNTIVGYVPPGYNALRTTLLKKEKTNIERMLGPIKISWKDKGYKDKHFIASLLIESIGEIGPHNVVQVITDNAAACKAAGLLIEAKFQHIFWTPCVVHTLNLALKNICSPSSHPRKERKKLNKESRFFDVVHGILVERWTKSNTPLHCLTHSLNPRYYHESWLEECPSCVPPYKDTEITRERKKCLERYFSNAEERRKIYGEFASFSGAIEDFAGADSVEDRGFMSPMKWWLFHGASTPTLQSIALKLLGQPCSSSCCERNWSTYNFIHSMRRNKMTPQRAEDLGYVYTNFRLLSRRSPTYNEGPSQQWDVGGDGFDSMNMENYRILETADLSLDEPDLEDVLFNSTASGSIIVDK
ncbi:hypothetical protein JRO89_XS11G0088300 [Xanthoceras sorbifolium]|uniref:Uncharacterized protein n=1 Tax=Xanthoceras sorbifolium TaxID=99658 RepID=A0ABQ8HFA6_9ROSI|nr:hypothetical protein JRO89_XS11G0088300 [Xanthoceras sorbifolium]